MGRSCTIEKCNHIGFLGINIVFSILGVALLTASCVVRYDRNMIDRYMGYSSFQNALETANVRVHTPSSLNIGETLDAVCTVFIVIGVLFLLLGIFGIIVAIVMLKSLLITYAVLLLVLVILQLTCVILAVTLRGKIEDWITYALKASIRNDYSGITGSDLDTLRWNFIMHSFQCCGVDRYTDFLTLPARRWNIEIEIDSIVTGKQIPFACCKVKDDLTCVLRPNSTTAFIEKGCYQVMRNWVINNASVLAGAGASILAIELVLVVLAFRICCTLRKDTHGKIDDGIPIKPYKPPQPQLVPCSLGLFHPSGAIKNPVHMTPMWYDNSTQIYPLRQPRELFNHYNQPQSTYDIFSHERDKFRGSRSHN